MTEKERAALFRRLRSTAGKTVGKQGLITPGEKVVIGLSGGKDSMVLVDLLASRLQYSKARYSLTAAHITISEIPTGADTDYLAHFCSQRGVDFIHHEVSIGKEFDKSTKPVCFLCSRNRRKELFKICHQEGSKTLALGHTLDDAIESLLMNMVFQGSISSIPAGLSMFNATFRIIRPLISITNRDLELYAREAGFKLPEKNCPWEKENHRDNFRKLIGDLEKISPDVRSNLFKCMNNIHHEYLPQHHMDWDHHKLIEN